MLLLPPQPSTSNGLRLHIKIEPRVREKLAHAPGNNASVYPALPVLKTLKSLLSETAQKIFENNVHSNDAHLNDVSLDYVYLNDIGLSRTLCHELPALQTLEAVSRTLRRGLTVGLEPEAT